MLAAKNAIALVESSRTSASVEDLYEAHARQVERWVRWLGGPGFDVEDGIQEVFLVACRRFREFRHEAKPDTWLFRIARNVVIRRRQKERLRKWLIERWIGGSAGQELTPDGSQQFEARQELARLHQAIARLPEHERVCVVLFELDGLPGDEVATMIGCSPATLWVRLHRARKRLFQLLERSDTRSRGET